MLASRFTVLTLLMAMGRISWPLITRVCFRRLHLDLAPGNTTSSAIRWATRLCGLVRTTTELADLAYFRRTRWGREVLRSRITRRGGRLARPTRSGLILTTPCL